MTTGEAGKAGKGTGQKATNFYIFEFKMNSAQKALEQIHKQKYAEMYLNKGKEIILVGVNFSEAERNSDAWIIEKGRKKEGGKG